jgi:hypothetical protein
MANQIVITSGAKVRGLNGVLTGTSGIVSSVPLGAANGVATLDSGGKVPVSQLPSSVVTYLGTWNAATNTPTLVNGTGDNGDLYICNVSGTVNFGAGPIAFVVGDWVLYGSGQWQKSSGQNGTVTSVAVTESGDSLNITGSPITTSGTINIGFNGTNLQYVNGAGNLTTFPTLITSIGLSMPSAFSVANSPLTANGTIAVTGAGVASQYIRGDGTLANFPTSGGGGSSVSYYLNGSINQGTIGGVTYYEMNKVPVIGAGTDFSRGSNGYIASFLTDANDPALLEIPAGNWNFETYLSASSGGGSPTFYIELYKYDGTTFTLIASNSAFPKLINDGTSIEAYFSALAVPQTSLTLTDRLAVRIYVTTAGRTITLHTENSHLCQVITTFSTGITALNGLTAQVQYFQVGTSGSDFNISSTTATHTFNIPDASATARGLITTGTQTIAGTKSFGIVKFDGGIYLKDSAITSIISGYTAIGSVTGGIYISLNGSIYQSTLAFNSAADFTYQFPSASGTIALVGGSGVGTVTSVAALTIGTSGTDLSSSVANSTTTPVITLNVPTASATNRGALSSADWTTFNNKQNALTNPITGTGTTNTLPKFTAASTIGNSNITDTGSLITLGSSTTISSGIFRVGSSSIIAFQLYASKNITGGTSAGEVLSDGITQSDVTNRSQYFATAASTAAASFTLASLFHFRATQSTFGAGSTVTNQIGFEVDATLIGATNNFGFRGLIPSGTNRWNLYMGGTAANYMAGSLGIGSTSLTGINLNVNKNVTGSTTSYNIISQGVIQSDVTSNGHYFMSVASTAAAAFTLPNLYHYRAFSGTFGAGSTVTNQYGFFADSTLTEATNDYGFYGNIGAATNRWNLYMAGTAANYMAGNTFIGATTDDTISRLQVYGTNWAANFNVTAAGGINLTRTNAVGNGSAHYSVVFKNSDSAVAAFNTINRTGGTTSTGTGYELNISTAGAGYITQSTNGVERTRVKSTGQMRFVPLAADPSGAEAGDVYYNSTISALKLYDGTVWRTITVI